MPLVLLSNIIGMKVWVTRPRFPVHFLLVWALESLWINIST